MPDQIVRLKIESDEYNNKIKRAQASLLDFTARAREAGQSLATTRKEDVEFVASLGKMETASRTANGKLREMETAFRELSLQYKQLTAAERQSPFGQSLKASLDELSTRVKSHRADLAEINAQLSSTSASVDGFAAGNINLQQVLGDLGGRLGVNTEIIGAMTTGTMAATAAVTAGAAAAGAAAVAWSQYNNELHEQDQRVTVTTGLSGEEAAAMSDKIKSLSQVYGVDFADAVNAVNTLMWQFGETGSEAFAIIAAGMQGTINGDAQKLLSMVQQFAPAFRDAGVSASELVAVINNTEGGIFTDENMSSIVMGIKNIRLLKDTTKDALEEIGVDADALQQRLNDGSISVFEALGEVSTALQTVDGNSKAAGEVLQAVFGKAGVTAGTSIAKAIATLNTNLKDTQTQTGRAGELTEALRQSHERLNTTLRAVFGTSAEGWHEFTESVKIGAIDAINDLLVSFVDLYNANSIVRDSVAITITSIGLVWESVKIAINNTSALLGGLGKELQLVVEAISKVVSGDFSGATDSLRAMGRAAKEVYYAWGANEADFTKNIKEWISSAVKAAKPIDIKSIAISAVTTQDTVSTGAGGTGSGKGGKRVSSTGSGKTSRVLTPSSSSQRPKTENTKSYTDYEVLQDYKATIEASMKPYARNTDDWRAMNEELQKVNAQLDEMDGKVKALSEGYSGLTSTALDKWISGLRTDLSNADVTSGQYANIASSLFDAETLKKAMSAATSNGLNAGDLRLDSLYEQLLGGEAIPTEVWQNLQDTINAHLADLDIKPINLVGGGQEAAKTWQKAANAVRQVGQAMKQIENPSAKVAAIIGEAIASIALGFAQATAKDSKLGVFGWVAAIAGGLGTMIGTISAIKSATAGSYADGGIIGGNYTTGDRLMARVNSGEVILNQQQQQSALAQIEARGQGVTIGEVEVRGDKLFLPIYNYMRQSGARLPQ